MFLNKSLETSYLPNIPFIQYSKKERLDLAKKTDNGTAKTSMMKNTTPTRNGKLEQLTHNKFSIGTYGTQHIRLYRAQTARKYKISELSLLTS